MTDLRTRIDAVDTYPCLVTRTTEPDETPILTLVDIAEPSDAAERSDAAEMPDPLIQALMDKLPKPNTIWSIDDRGSWLKAAAMAFNLVYRTAEVEQKQTPSVLKSVNL